MSNLNKNGFTSKDIEKQAVNKVRSLCIHKKLEENIESNDKTVSFDGTIELYKRGEKTKKDLENIIHIQVKGTNNQKIYNSKNKVSFYLEKCHLENYKLENGVLFLLGVSNKTGEIVKIFYADLHVDKINCLLEEEKYKNKK